MKEDSLFFNKIAGAILSAGLLAMVAGFIAHEFYHTGHLEEPAYVIATGVATTKTDTAEAKPAGPEPIADLLASADVAKGEKVAKKCGACHNFVEGAGAKVGPDLYNIVNRQRASMEGFSYSDAMASKGGEWTYDDLNHFIYNPKDFVPGTKMNFAGIKKTQDRADLIAYLRTLSHDPAPLP